MTLIKNLRTRSFGIALDAACILHAEFFAHADAGLKKDNPCLEMVEPFIHDTHERLVRASADVEGMINGCKLPRIEHCMILNIVLKNALMPMTATFGRFNRALLPDGSLIGKSKGKPWIRADNDARESNFAGLGHAMERGGKAMRPDNATAITHYKVVVPRGHQPSAMVVKLAKEKNKKNKLERKTLYAQQVAYGHELLAAAAKREEKRKMKLEAQSNAASKPVKKRKGSKPDTDAVLEEGKTEIHGVIFRVSSIKEQQQSREERAAARKTK